MSKKLCFLFFIFTFCCLLSTVPAQQLHIEHKKNTTQDMLIYIFPAQGWYLVSVPMQVEDNSLKTLFPEADGAFSFDNVSYNYKMVSHLENGQGYWLAISQASSAMIQGELINEFTNHYTQGWYLLGSVIDSVDFSNPYDNPDGSVLLPLFAWDEVKQDYYATTTVEQAYGHWMAVMSECDVTVKSNATLTKAKKINLQKQQDFFVNYGCDPPPPPFILQPDLSTLPTEYMIVKNYPNPFNGITTIEFSLDSEQQTDINIYDVTGKKIVQLYSGSLSSGIHEFRWDGTNSQNQLLSSGLYFFRLVSADIAFCGKMVFVR